MKQLLVSFVRAATPAVVRRKILSARSIWRSPDRNFILRNGVRRLLVPLRNVVRMVTTAVLLIWLGNRLSNFALLWAIRLSPKLSALRLARGTPRSLWGVTPILTLP